MECARGLVVSLAVGLACPAVTAAQEGASYQGEYANAFIAGTTADGRDVAVMAGYHRSFPYPESRFDQVAVQVGSAEAVVVTGRPRLEGLKMELGEKAARMSFTGRQVTFDLELAAVRHEPRFEGDPAGLGDLLIGLGIRSERSPGFVYTPFELLRVVSGRLTVRGRSIRLRALHGQAETGRLEAPTDPRFRSAYDYLAVPTIRRPASYTYVGFTARALHGGASNPFDAYFRENASDEFTLEAGSLTDGNTRSAPRPFDNTWPPPGGTRLAQWAVDLGPGVLYRKLVRLRDRAGAGLLALSETIHEDDADGPDAAPPQITGARTSRRRLRIRVSEPALVFVRPAGSPYGIRADASTGPASLRLPAWRARSVLVAATDEAGNRSPSLRVRYSPLSGGGGASGTSGISASGSSPEPSSPPSAPTPTGLGAGLG